MMADPTWNPRREQLEAKFLMMDAVHRGPNASRMAAKLRENMNARRQAVSQVRAIDNMILAQKNCDNFYDNQIDQLRQLRSTS